MVTALDAGRSRYTVIDGVEKESIVLTADLAKHVGYFTPGIVHFGESAARAGPPPRNFEKAIVSEVQAPRLDAVLHGNAVGAAVLAGKRPFGFGAS